jgi:hypothetical protein
VVIRLVAAAVLLVLVACSGGDDDSNASRDDSPRGDRQRDRPTSTTEARPPVTLDPAEEAALRSLLVEETLTGFTPAPDKEFDAGPLDLEAAARAEGDVEAERALLETRHFRAGYSKAWTGGNSDVVLVTLYRFASHDDAAAYLLDGADTLLARGAETFDVPDVPESLGFTQLDETRGGSFTGHGVAFVNGEHYVLVVVGSPGSSRTPDEAQGVAVAQLHRLQARPSG